MRDATIPLRQRITSIMILLIVTLCMCVGVTGVLGELGFFLTFSPSMENPLSVSVACLIAAVAGIGVFFVHQRTGSPWFARGYAAAIAVLVVVPMPDVYFAEVIPQSIWLPILIAAVLCDLPSLAAVCIFTFGLVVFFHSQVPALQTLISPVLSIMLASLLLAFRWLHDTGLKIEDQERQRATFLAYHDPLTTLPNRRQLMEHLTEAIKDAKRTSRKVGLLLMDLDHFARINDTLGHDTGDRIIQEISQRLQTVVRPTQTLARFSGDEFVIVLPDTPGPESVRQLANEIANQINIPITLGKQDIHLTTSIGIALYPQDGQDPETLLQYADQALFSAKESGRDQISMSTTVLQEQSKRRFQLSQELRSAIERDEFHVVYQPICNIRTGRIQKAEALIRWTHTHDGPISPGEFIPIAESNGTIHELGDWILRRAAHQAQVWRNSVEPDFQVSVNRSPIQFLRDQNLQHHCLTMLQELNVEPDTVILEMTEGLLLEATESILKTLQQLRSAGVKLSMDDFGTGYSSLSQLHRFNMDFVKIDQSFVRNLVKDSKDYILCRSIITMSHSLGLKVVAEGIETQEQLDLLNGLGCDYGQGYFIGRPMPAEDFERLVFQEREVS